MQTKQQPSTFWDQQLLNIEWIESNLLVPLVTALTWCGFGPQPLNLLHNVLPASSSINTWVHYHLRIYLVRFKTGSELTTTGLLRVRYWNKNHCISRLSTASVTKPGKPYEKNCLLEWGCQNHRLCVASAIKEYLTDSGDLLPRFCSLIFSSDGPRFAFVGEDWCIRIVWSSLHWLTILATIRTVRWAKWSIR